MRRLAPSLQWVPFSLTTPTMPILLLTLLLGALAYLWWKRTATTLTRDCRWREDRAAGEWVCAFCDARMASNGPPKLCQNPSAPTKD